MERQSTVSCEMHVRDGASPQDCHPRGGSLSPPSPGPLSLMGLDNSLTASEHAGETRVLLVYTRTNQILAPQAPVL